MSKSSRIGDLERQVQLLRVQLDALRQGLADKITTRHLIVDNDDGVTVELSVLGLTVSGADSDCIVGIGPDRIEVCHDATGCHAVVQVEPNGATVGVVAGDTVHALADERMTVWLEATRDCDVVGEPDKRASVEVNGVELAASQPAS